MMARILLIGGGGYVGTAMTNYFNQNNHQIIIIDNFVYGHQVTNQGLLTDTNIAYHFLDYTDQENLAEICKLGHEADAIIILAGLVGDPITKKYPGLSESTNDVGMRHMIEEFSKQSYGEKQVIFVSTCSNYGLMKDGQLADETSELSPLSLYAKAKVQMEKIILEKALEGSLNGTILRFATAFGMSNRMRFDLTVNQFTREIAVGNELVVFDADTWRPYCHVNDFARLADVVIRSDNNLTRGEVFNAGGDENNYTKRGLIDLIGTKLDISKVSYRENGGDPRNYKVSFQKLNNTLHFQPKYTVENGIDEIINAIQCGFFTKDVEQNNLFGNYILGAD